MKKIFIFILLIVIFQGLIFCDLYKEGKDKNMACELVTPPTGGAPLTTDDYDAQNQILQSLLYSLMQNTCHLTEWDTLNTPEVAENSYIQHGGALYRVNDSDSAIAGAPANGRVYIKVTEAADVLTFSFVNSAAGYSWNSVYNGFYHVDSTQLLPYILYKTASGYHKYTLKDSENKFDITELIKITLTGNQLGAWDMDATGYKDYLYSANDILAVLTNGKTIDELTELILIENCYIFNDSKAVARALSAAGDYLLSITALRFTRETGALFDSVEFNDPAINRGYYNYTIRL